MFPVKPIRTHQKTFCACLALTRLYRNNTRGQHRKNPSFLQDPGKAGAPLAKETIILEPTSPTTHFAFKPPPHNYVDSQGNVVVEAALEGNRGRDDDRMRLDRFQHVPGSRVCRGSLGHVKVLCATNESWQYGWVAALQQFMTENERTSDLQQTVLCQSFGPLITSLDPSTLVIEIIRVAVRAWLAMFSRQGMDGRYYHHYSSSDRMWYMPEHPGPYPAPAEPPSLEQLEIAPPHAEQPMSPVSGEVRGRPGTHGIWNVRRGDVGVAESPPPQKKHVVTPTPYTAPNAYRKNLANSGQVALPSPEELPGTESPNPPPLSRHYMKASMEACLRCHEGGQCPGQGLCPLLGVVPVESMVLLVQEPRLKASNGGRCSSCRSCCCCITEATEMLCSLVPVASSTTKGHVLFARRNNSEAHCSPYR